MREISPFIALIAAVFLSIIFFPIGIVWHFFKPLYDGYLGKKKFRHIILHFITYWFLLLYQVWCAIKYLVLKVAVAIDILGNVIIGEFLEDTITAEEKTLFMDGSTTVSASVGQLEKTNKLNAFGKIFTKLLSKVFEENHSINAYDKKVILDEFDKSRGVEI